jgi:hypothetical protein
LDRIIRRSYQDAKRDPSKIPSASLLKISSKLFRGFTDIDAIDPNQSRRYEAAMPVLVIPSTQLDLKTQTCVSLAPLEFTEG